MMVAVMQHLPVGYRFHPTDGELLGHYLLRKNLGQEDSVCAIPEVNLYRWEPEELIMKFRESSIIQSKDAQWWFFCEQRPGRTQQRSTKGGFWKKTGKTRAMRTRYDTRQVSGSKKFLTFFRGNSSSSTKTDWIMHEYDLRGNAINRFRMLNRKSYVLCMIKSNSDEMANSTPAYECEWDEPVTNISDHLLKPEADDGIILEHVVQARMQSLETLCRTRNECENIYMLRPFGELPVAECIESDSEFSSSDLLVGDAIESDSSFSTGELFGRYSTRAWDSSSYSSEWSESLEDISNQALVDQDVHHFISEIPTLRNGTQASEPFVRRRLELQAAWDDNASETLRPREQAGVIMENKQSQKLEPLYAFWPTGEKKGIVEDNSPQPTTSVRAKAPEVKIEKECLEIIPEAKAQRHAPIKIEEISVSAAGSLSTSIHKPRKPATDATCTARGEETDAMAALSDHKKPARELKLESAETEPVSCSCSRSIKHHSSSTQSMVYARNLLVGIILCIVIFYEMLKPLIF